MSGKQKTKATVLVVLDGWGVAKPSKNNAITQAGPLFFDHLAANYPAQILAASGEAVGLPAGIFGNSEVGHLTLGAGRVVYQDLLRINQAIKDGEFFKNKELLAAAQKVKKTGGAWHLAGLASDGQVHSSLEHLFSLLDLAKRLKIKKVFLHLFLDGRDTSRSSGAKFVAAVEGACRRFGVGKISTLSGRFYAMDRDNHWERIAPVYEAMVNRQGQRYLSATAALKASYQAKIYDEEFVPALIEGGASVKEGDVLIFFNYRADRARQLSRAFTDKNFKTQEFRLQRFKNLDFISFTNYDKKLPLKVVFPPFVLKNCLGEILSKHHKKQLRVAETEKYAHVTYFFNGGREKPFVGEDRILIPSPRVLSYAKKPQMSAAAVAGAVVDSLKTNKYSFILVNFANPDMVGHTGNLEATIKAVQAADRGLKRIVKAVLKEGGDILIVADHGNADSLYDSRRQEIIKEHTTNPVPFIWVSSASLLDSPSRFSLHNKKPSGTLIDIAPTVLKIQKITPPSQMSGKSLI
ncbi:MAG: 2,3-bisphosphoglycerate-independent phosphoglycerate mutase [Patescibacteria group bacterium]|nr:2,3-bisphosphoglycerate-independent phosphoglycerate mutase [Patescibacteria group bacterium]